MTEVTIGDCKTTISLGVAALAGIGAGLVAAFNMAVIEDPVHKMVGVAGVAFASAAGSLIGGHVIGQVGCLFASGLLHVSRSLASATMFIALYGGIGAGAYCGYDYSKDFLEEKLSKTSGGVTPENCAEENYDPEAVQKSPVPSI